MTILPKLSGALAYGGDYNPEQWPESVWREDAALMREAGVNIVSVGIFAWAKLQPAPGQWDFGWLDRVLGLLAESGVSVCLATATASPPAWLVRQHPSVLPVNAAGQTLYPGSRQHYSPSSARYREAAAELVAAIADRYASHPALAAWHINNEYACHMPECHSDESTAAFRLWLKRKYSSLDALNAAWGATFWSQTYTDWDQIFTPRQAPYFSNPTQQLDFKRFTSDAFLELLLMEKRILRERSPDVPVNTNFMGFFKPLDYQRWAEELDFASWDSYPDPLDEPAGRRAHAAGNDLTRSLKPGHPFVLMEQATSAVNWRDINRPKRPGLMRLWSLQTVARGGDGVMFFQWRASKAGTEKYHSAVIQHSGAAPSRVYHEAVALGTELQRLAPVSGSVVRAEAAILFDWDNWWSVEIDSRPGRIDYAQCAHRFHAWFYERNIPVDFVSPKSSQLDNYKVLIAPSLYLIDDASAARLENFVAQGGSLLATYFSGIVDENDHARLGGYPGALRKALGIQVEEWCPYGPTQRNRISFAADAAFDCDHWCDVASLEGAEALANFESDFFAGRPAFTRNRFGKGHAFHLGTRPDTQGLARVLEKVCLQTAQLQPLVEAPPGVEASLRVGDKGRFLFLLNHTDASQEIPLGDFQGQDLLSQSRVADTLTLPPLGAAVVESRLRGQVS